MTNYKLYRLFVIGFLGLFLVAKSMVGAAGHSGTTLLDYGTITFTISTLTIQTLFLKVKADKKRLKTFLRFALMTLVFIGLTYCIYEFIDSIIIDGFATSRNIIIYIIVLFIFSSAKLFIDLYKNRILVHE